METLISMCMCVCVCLSDCSTVIPNFVKPDGQRTKRPTFERPFKKPGRVKEREGLTVTDRALCRRAGWGRWEGGGGRFMLPTNSNRTPCAASETRANMQTSSAATQHYDFPSHSSLSHFTLDQRCFLKATLRHANGPGTPGHRRHAPASVRLDQIHSNSNQTR